MCCFRFCRHVGATDSGGLLVPLAVEPPVQLEVPPLCPYPGRQSGEPSGCRPGESDGGEHNDQRGVGTAWTEICLAADLYIIAFGPHENEHWCICISDIDLSPHIRVQLHVNTYAWFKYECVCVYLFVLMHACLCVQIDIRVVMPVCASV